MTYVTIPAGADVAFEEDWSARTPDDASLATSNWLAIPAGVVTFSGKTFAGGLTQVNIAAEEAGKQAQITNLVTFDDGSTDSARFTVRVV